MKAFLLLLTLLQDVPTIEFPEPLQPAPQIEDEPQPQPTADTFATDQLYLIQSDLSLVISPESSLSARSLCACLHAVSYALNATATSSAGGCGRPSGGVVCAAVTFKIRRLRSTTSADPAGRISSSAVPAASPRTT